MEKVIAYSQKEKKRKILIKRNFFSVTKFSFRILNLTINGLRSISKRRSIDDYQSMSKKELEDLFTKPTLPLLRPKTYVRLPRPRKLLHSPISISSTNMDKFEETEMKKKILFATNTWYDWLINHILEPVKSSE